MVCNITPRNGQKNWNNFGNLILTKILVLSSKEIFGISQNHISLQFQVAKSRSCLISIILEISHEIALKCTRISLKITKNRENYHSLISRFTLTVKRENMFMLNSH